MGGFCWIVVGQEVGNNVINKDFFFIDDKVVVKSLFLYEKFYELYQIICQCFEKWV